MKGVVELAAEFDFYKNGGTSISFVKGNGKAQEGQEAPGFN